MYRLVVLCFTLFAVAVVRPSPIYTHLPPAAISYQSRLDIIESKPTLSVVYDNHDLVRTFENIEEAHVIPVIVANPIVENSYVPEDHEELLHEHDDIISHDIHQTHDGPVILALTDSVVHNSEEIHSILTSEHQDHPGFDQIHEIHETPVVLSADHIVHNAEEIYPILSSEIHEIHGTPVELAADNFVHNAEEIHPISSSEIHEIHGTPVELSADHFVHNAEEIHPILSSGIHEEHLPEHEVQQISILLHQTHDSPASTSHAIPVLSGIHQDSEEIHSIAENFQEPDAFHSDALVHF